MLARLLAALLTATAATAAPPPPVTAVAYSADGALLAAGTRGVVHVLDSATGNPLAELTGHTARVTAVAFGKPNRLAVASGEPGTSGTVRLYDGVTAQSSAGKLVAELPGHTDVVYAVAFSPDGGTLATAGYDRTIKLWDVTARKPAARLTLTDHSDSVHSVAFHPSGRLLASASADRAVKVWDVESGRRLYTLSDPTDWVYAVAWSPDGRRLAAGGADKSIRVWEATADGGKLVASAFAHDRAVTHLAYPAFGNALYSVGEDRIIKAWDSAKMTELRALPVAAETVLAFAARPDGQQLAVGRFDGVLQVLNAATGKPVAAPLPMKPKPPSVVKVTPDAAPRGTTVRVTVEGTNLTAATGAKANVTGVRAILLLGSSADTRRQIDLAIPADTPPGPLQLRFSSAAGDSGAVQFWVDRFPAVAETGQTDSARTAMIVPIPTTLVGRLDRPGDTDFFRFTASSGQEVGAQLQTDADRGKFEAVVFLTDETGQVLAEAADGLLGYVCPKAGTFALGVRDREYRGGPELAYRLHVGPVPVVTSVFPLSVTRGQKTAVQIHGVNLPPAARSVTVAPPMDAALGSTIPVPLPRAGGNPVGRAEVTVGEFPAVAVRPDRTTALSAVPGVADGLFTAAGEAHTVRFPARRGHRLIVEVRAARLGSPVDSHVEILDSSGRPVEQATLRCTAKTYVTFRDHNSEGPGIRLETWNEIGIDDYLYVGEELVRVKALPRGPDDDAQFYSSEGKRVAFLGTTPTHHAQGSPMYKVEFHPPGANLPPNGMPVFRLMYRNDDGGPGCGKDSRVFFDPPADGEYQVRVRDATGSGGPTHAYQLTVRPPRPDFAVRVSPTAPKVWKGGAVPLTVTTPRADGYDSPIAVRFEEVPPLFSVPNTVIEAGQETAAVALSAAATAPAGKALPLRVVATAEIDGREVRRETTLASPEVVEPGDLTTAVNVSELVVRPGTEARIRVRVERRDGLTGRVPIEVRGLPHGIRVLNVGLNGILITPEMSEREVVLYAETWVKPTAVPVVVLSRSERKGTEHAAPSILIRVR